MEKRKYQKILCIFASMIMIVNQLGIIQVFAETIVPEFKLSIEESTVQVNKEFSVTASGTEEQIETFKLEENSSISELGTEKIDATHIKIHLKATEIGVYNLIGQSESGEKTKALLVTVTNSGIDDSSNKELSTIEKNNSKSIDSKKSMFESTIESTNQEAKGGVTLRAAGDDPGVEITATNPISSRSSVDLRVVMNTSAGNLDEDGHINILIPKSIVLSSSELISNLALGDPFYLGSPAVKDDGNGNYVMNIAYDHTKIDQTQAKNYEFHVKFTAPVMYIGDDHPDTVDFNTELYKGNDLVSKDTATSNTIKGKPGTPLIQKWSTRRHSSVNGVNAAILSQDNPSSNIFAITINYSGSVQKNATLVDVTPEGTQLVDPGNYIPATGDKTPINHIRIAKVTGRDSSGIPSSWEYVTSEFQGKINLTSTGFSIAFGDIGSEDAYVVMYASEVTGFPTPDEFGVRYNKVDLKSDGTTVGRAQEAVALDSNSYTATSLKKEVSSKTISTTEGELQYSLTAASDTGVIPAGTIISDPLPEYTKFIKTDEMDSEYFSDAVYNADTNTVSYTLLKDIVQKDSSTIKFTVHYKNDQALANDKISNIATYNPSGTPIRSNDGTTVLNGSAYLYKIDKDTKNPLEGAKFKIIDSNGTLVANNLTSDENGFINSGVLKPGNYEFIETQAPAGYELDETPIKFTVVEGQKTPINLTATNTLTPGGVVLSKTDGTTGDVLQGAVFELQDKDGKVLQSGLITDESGKLAVDKLAPGSYQFVETQAPTGYELDKTPVTFTITKGQTQAVQVSMTNTLTPGGVVLSKTDGTTGDVLQGAVFELQDKDGKVLQSGLITDESGKLAVDKLAPGSYQFVETQAPTGYELDKTPVTFTITKGQTQAVQVSMTNTLTPGGVVLSKTDAKTGEALQGAVFELQDKNGKALQSGLTTDVSGKLAVDGLEPGDYQFVETQAPTGYELDKTPVTFTITKGQTQAVQVSMTNTLTPGGVVLSKTDAKTGEALQGAVFELQDKNGKALQSGLTTDVSGKLAVDGLEPGDYQFVETQAPTGYDLDQTPVAFVIKKGQTEAIQVSMTNKATVGSVVLNKIDSETGDKLAGAVFELRDNSGNVVLEGLKTDNNGKLAINDLKPGTYELVETKAPEGYVLDDTPIEFIIKSNTSEQKEVTKTNKGKANSVRVEKRDSRTNEMLKGAKFKLLDSKNKIIKEDLVTNGDGVLTIDGLKEGDYQLIEVQAPTGYSLDDTAINFTINKTSSLIKLTKLNAQESNFLNPENSRDSSKSGYGSNSYFPKTGEKNSIWLAILGVAMIIIILVTWVVRRKLNSQYT